MPHPSELGTGIVEKLRQIAKEGYALPSPDRTKDRYSDYGVMVVDFPGCFSTGGTLDEALKNAEESAVGWIDATLDDGDAIPPPSTPEKVRAIEPDWIIAYVNVDPALLDDTTERVNITMPRRVLRRLHDLAKSAGESRAGYIAAMTLAIGRLLPPPLILTTNTVAVSHPRRLPSRR